MTVLNQPLHTLDPEIAAAADAELHRQQSTLEMIADIIAEALKPDFNPGTAATLTSRVAALSAKHPLYSDLLRSA